MTDVGDATGPADAPDPILACETLTRSYGVRIGCSDVTFSLWPGEVMGIVGESGSGKSTLLRCLAGVDLPSAGRVLIKFNTHRQPIAPLDLPEDQRRALMRTAWGIVHQNPRDGLRMSVSAGGNIAERLLDRGDRNYGAILSAARQWLERVEIPSSRTR